MELFIRIKDNLPIDHPVTKENLLLAFGEIPSDFEPFQRVLRPELKPYEILESEQPEYRKIEGTWTDVWKIRPMTLEEKSITQQKVIDVWENQDFASNYSSWVFDETTCSFLPPKPYPSTDPGDVMIFWSGSDNDWKIMPPKPESNLSLQFNPMTWQWTDIYN